MELLPGVNDVFENCLEKETANLKIYRKGRRWLLVQKEKHWWLEQGSTHRKQGGR
jgi:hypothetical protein